MKKEKFASALHAPIAGLKAVVRFYVDGFRNMTVGRSLWAIILIKLFIMFAILRYFFFPNFLSENFDNDEERAAHVRHELINR